MNPRNEIGWTTHPESLEEYQARLKKAMIMAEYVQDGFFRKKSPPRPENEEELIY